LDGAFFSTRFLARKQQKLHALRKFATIEEISEIKGMGALFLSI